MENKDFAVFILTHGRADNVKTINTLNKCGYTGKVYLIVDNEDKSVDQYIANFGSDKVIVFDKKAIADTIDEGNNFDERKCIIHARNFCFEAAKQVGVKYFLELDDDYTSFEYRYANKENTKLLVKQVLNLDVIINLHLDFYKATNFKSIAFAQGGDFIGGVINPTINKGQMKRKCMNSFFCSTDRPFQFIGAMNEDVNTYTTLGSRGVLFATIPFISLSQAATQSQSGGITDLYLKYGTYCKSFTTVMMQPSSVTVRMMQSANSRLHHSIKWNNTVPCIISEDYKIKQ
jgi:hypothetical protein